MILSRLAFVLIITFILTMTVVGWWFVERPLPQHDGLIKLTDLSQPVSVYFDGRAVPYVKANCLSDAYLAQGFLTASDRMFQMDMLRRIAEGKLSEVFGATCLPQDKLMRTIGCGRLAAVEVKQQTPEVKAMLESFCHGVNLYLSCYHDKPPLEFSLLGYKPQPWQPADSLAVMKYLCYLQDESWQLDDLRERILDKVGADIASQLFVEEGPVSSVAWQGQDNKNIQQLMSQIVALGNVEHKFMDPSLNIGSSAWAVSGKNTDSGSAILACSKDQALSKPDIFYLISLNAPGLHAAGATVPGVPGICFGRNDFISWGSASLKADVQDLFLEEFSPQFPMKYKTSTGWQNALEITEEIPVRLAPSFLHKVLLTNHGPILIKNDVKAVALNWIGNNTNKSALESIYLLNRADNWQNFQEAIKSFPGPAQVFVYADRWGNIGYHAAGDIPIRSSNGNGMTMTYGAQAQGQWIGTIPFTDLPSDYNPAQGYVIAANQKLVKAGCPWLIGHQWCAPYRAMRLESQLTNLIHHGKIDLPEANDLQADQVSCLAPLVIHELQQTFSETQEIDQHQQTAINILKSWDANLKGDSAAAAIYESFLYKLAYNVLTPKLGVDLTQDYLRKYPSWPLFIGNYLKNKKQYWLPPEQRTSSTFIVSTFSQAVNSLRLFLRKEDAKQWAWQAIHKASFQHIMASGMSWLGFLGNIGPIGVGGDADTVNTFDIAGNTSNGNFACKSGSVLRLLIDQSDQTKFYQSLSLGQSGHILSPHACDQLSSWLKVDPLPIAFSAVEIDHLSQYKLILTPTSLATK